MKKALRWYILLNWHGVAAEVYRFIFMVSKRAGGSPGVKWSLGTGIVEWEGSIKELDSYLWRMLTTILTVATLATTLRYSGIAEQEIPCLNLEQLDYRSSLT